MRGQDVDAAARRNVDYSLSQLTDFRAFSPVLSTKPTDFWP
jgi:hypothetical protein